MIRRIGKRKYSIYGYDVESHNDEESIEKGETSIWLSVFANEETKVTDESCYFYTIESWLDKLEELSKPNKRKICNLMIYIFNLAFEWSFILPKLLERGFVWKEKPERKGEFCSVSTKTCSSVWQVKIKFHDKTEVVLRDLRKILQGSLASIAESFNTPTQKGITDIDYTLNRLHNHVVTPIEKQYCFKDVRILIEILMEMDKRDDKDFWKCCSASSYACTKMIRQGYKWAKKPMLAFREDYPLLDERESAFLRNATSGGITYATPKYQFKEIKQRIKHIDIHQAHPNSAFRNKFPYGKGKYFNSLKDYPNTGMSCLHVKVSYSGVKLHNIIELITLDCIDDYELWLWDFELRQMKECYEDLVVEFIEGYNYQTKMLPWRMFYKDNYELRELAKKRKDLFEIHQRKLLNNSSYGKLLEHGHLICFENCLDGNGLIDSLVHDSSKGSDNAKYTCLQVGGVIPAYTRHYLIDTALKLGWENIVYFDTDSIFYIDNEETRENIKKVSIGNNLGDFGFEPDIIEGQFTAPKRYKIREETDDGIKDTYHCAGINFITKPVNKNGTIKYYCAGHEVKSEDDQIPYNELNIVDGKFIVQGTKRVKGGTLIIMQEKKMSVQSKYLDVYNKNRAR